MSQNNTPFIIIILITILICGTSMMLLYNQSIRLDEAQSIWISTKSIPSLLKLTSEDVHVPLYGILLHFWIQIWGTNIVYVRTLSLFFFILTLPVIYTLVAESSNKKIAILSVALFALSPFIVWYGNEARMYTLFTLVSSLNHLFFLRMWRSGGQSSKVSFFISTILGFYTHYFFIFLIAAQILFVFLKLITRGIKRMWWNIYVYLGLLSSAFFVFLPWLVYVVINGTASNSRPLIETPTSYNIIQTFVNFIFGFQSPLIQSILVSLWPLLTIIMFLVFTNKNRQSLKSPEYFVLATFLPIILVFVASFLRPIFLSRYLILVTPTLFLILAWILTSYQKKISFFLTTFTLLTMFGLLMMQNISAATPVKEDYAQLASYLQSQASAQDIVTISAPFTIYPIEYQYSGQSKLTTIPEWDRFEVGSIPGYSEEKMVAQVDDYKTVYTKMYLVLSYDQGYEDNIREYMDTHFAMLENKQFSNNIDLRVYKLRY